MSFKNAFKILISRFNVVWVILLYLVMMFVVLLSLGLTFLLPVYRALKQAGISDMFNKFILSIFDGESLTHLVHDGGEIVDAMRVIFKTDVKTFVNSLLFVLLVATIAYRFIIGLYELPLVSVIMGTMTDNARYGYAGKYLAYLGKSAKFSLVKMLVMIVFDIIMYGIIFILTNLSVNVGIFFAPFMFALTTLVFYAFRYSLIAAWSPAIVVDGKPIFRSLGHSVKYAFKHFGKIFSMYTVVWVMIFVFNMVIGVFTFLAGLLITIPMSMYFINILNMTFYYARHDKKYYVNNEVYTPVKLMKE